MEKKIDKGGRKKRHGDSPRNGKKSKEYYAWDHMKGRCLRPNYSNYHRYGGRGIKICKRWMVYENFLADVGRAPSPTHSLDRYPNKNGHYTPGNVRWATPKEQSNNTRRNIMVRYLGVRYTLPQVVEKYGVDYKLVLERLKRGWKIKRAIETPKIIRNPKT